mmetsp:Transcript_121362/g.354746  ORF Transcript_121362/g.354746 Transcript_121362/m.354746 type:complete len:223 (-) Transcript_121362:9-677(-)
MPVCAVRCVILEGVASGVCAIHNGDLLLLLIYSLEEVRQVCDRGAKHPLLLLCELCTVLWPVASDVPRVVVHEDVARAGRVCEAVPAPFLQSPGVGSRPLLAALLFSSVRLCRRKRLPGVRLQILGEVRLLGPAPVLGDLVLVLLRLRRGGLPHPGTRIDAAPTDRGLRRSALRRLCARHGTREEWSRRRRQRRPIGRGPAQATENAALECSKGAWGEFWRR